MYYPVRMIRTRTYKLLVNYAHGLEYPFASDLWGSATWQGVLRRKDANMGKRSVERFLHRPKLELYHLLDDPNELTNFAGNPRNEKLVAELRGRLLEWQKATADPWLVKERYE
jgi:N-sulfoglucosamine sulfohydrolase